MSAKAVKLFNHIPEETATASLAFIGGFVDAAGYLKLQGLFTSSITGNLVVACASILESYGVICRVAVSLAFFVGTGVGTTLALRLKIVEELGVKQVATRMFSAEILAFLIALAFGQSCVGGIDSDNSLDNWQVVLAGTLMGFAMGVHNSAAKESIANCPATTVMTMTMVTVSTNLSTTINYFLCVHCGPLISMRPRNKPITEQQAYLKGVTDKYLDFRKKFVTTSKPLWGFLGGALVGAGTMYAAEFFCLLIPVFILLVLLADINFGGSPSAQQTDTSKAPDSGTAVVNALIPAAAPAPVSTRPVTAADGNRVRADTGNSKRVSMEIGLHEPAV